MRAEAWHEDRATDTADNEARRLSRMWLTTLSGLFLAAAFVVHLILSDWTAAIGLGSSHPPVVVLMNDNLSRVAWLMDQSHRTLRVIRQNIVASLGVKAAMCC
jgi:hypothetical protein